MAVAGIDVGSQSTKVVILEGDRILAAVTLKTGESGESEARQAMEEALGQARLKLEDVKNVVSTGTGRMSVPFARKQRTIGTCLARGPIFSIPGPDSARCGGRWFHCRQAVGRGHGRGHGDQRTVRGERRRVPGHHEPDAADPLAELGAESLKATNAETISSTCAVFAESEVVSLVHRDPPSLSPTSWRGSTSQ